MVLESFIARQSFFMGIYVFSMWFARKAHLRFCFVLQSDGRKSKTATPTKEVSAAATSTIESATTVTTFTPISIPTAFHHQPGTTISVASSMPVTMTTDVLTVGAGGHLITAPSNLTISGDSAPPVLQLVNTLAGPMLVPTSMASVSSVTTATAAPMDPSQFPGGSAQRILTPVPVNVQTGYCSGSAGLPIVTPTSTATSIASGGGSQHGGQQTSPGTGKS
jgi:hypothetical protein